LRRSLPITLLIYLASAVPTAAQIDAPDGVALSAVPVLQAPASYPLFGDNLGGVWTAYLGSQPGSPVYANHIWGDGSYAPGFGPVPTPLTVSGTQANSLSAAPDGLGAAVVTWFGVNPADSTSPFLALRFKRITGTETWPATFADTGAVVSDIASAALVVGDGHGGAYVVWEELKGVSNPEIYAQHYDFFGLPTWTPVGSPTGVPVCAVVGIQRLRALHADGHGGAYVIWSDQRVSATVPLYVAHLEAAGVEGGGWTTNGIRITPVTSGIRIVGSNVAPDGSLLLAWRDLGVNNMVWGQRVAENGGLRWGASGATVASVTPLRLDWVPATGGGAFATWGDADLRCSLMDSTGARVWGTEPAGRLILTPTNGALDCHAASDGAGGQRIAWTFDNAGQGDVLITHVDGSATLLPGEPPGGEVFVATAAMESPVAWFPPPFGDAPLLAWLSDGVLRVRQLPGSSVGVGPSGTRAGLALAPPWPNPLRGTSHASLRFSAPPGEARLEVFDLAGRRVAGRSLAATGTTQSVDFGEATTLAPGVYVLRLSAGGRDVQRRFVRVE
jgi:hypothetical protein